MIELTIQEAQMLLNLIGELPGNKSFEAMALLLGKAKEVKEKANTKA